MRKSGAVRKIVTVKKGKLDFLFYFKKKSVILSNYVCLTKNQIGERIGLFPIVVRS